MSKPVPYLERRSTGFYWRRRVPVAIARRYSASVFCFPLRTHVLREAAAVASRITAIVAICFRAEIDVSPDVMTRLLVTYARLEIEASDRVRALTGPRTREAAEAGLAVETAIRASLRDAMFLCERDPAIRAVETTARHLGLEISGDDADLPILVDRMLRLMLELSVERERRARGHFSDRQPYLDLALSGDLLPQPATPAPAPASVAHAAGDAPTAVAPLFVSRRTPVPDAPPHPGPSAEERAAPMTSIMLPDPSADRQDADVLFADDRLTIRFSAPAAAATSAVHAPSLPELFDLWFDYKATGTVTQGSLEVADATLAETFLRNGDTYRSTRRIVDDFFGARPAREITEPDWQAFVVFLRRIPRHHGKSPQTRHLPLEQVIREADRADAQVRSRSQPEKDQKADQRQKRSAATALVERISARTVQRHQMTLAAVLDHAVEIGAIEQHGFRGFVLKDKTVAILKSASADTTRLLWGAEFGALLATERWSSPDTRIDDPLYWVPLIARMHGLRSEEILQLEVSNVREMDGIAFFDILQGTGQSLKSDSARRMVPIHSQLIELGFLDLVDHQKTLGERRLFPRAKRAKTAKATYSAIFTKAFTYYRKSKNVYDPRMDLHALRTSFNSGLVAARVPDTARRYLMGHVNADVGITNYLPEGFPIATLKAIIEEQRFDLSMVKQVFAKDANRRPGPVLATSNGQTLPRPGARRVAS